MKFKFIDGGAGCKAFMESADISTCPRCGNTDTIIHYYNRDGRRVDFTGFVCCRCLYRAGGISFLTAIRDIVEFNLKRRDKDGH